MLSPTWLAVRKAEIEERLSKAHVSNDVRALQRTLTELTAISRAYYGGHRNRRADDDG